MKHHDEVETAVPTADTGPDTSRKLAEWNPQYQADLREIAQAAGVDPEELHRRIDDRLASTDYTEDCLSLTEFDEWSAGSLAGFRRDHAVSCAFCSDTMTRMAQASPALKAEFLNAATGDPSRKWIVAAVGAVGAAGALGALWATRTRKADHDKE